jgi:hypothetical protein
MGKEQHKITAQLMRGILSRENEVIGRNFECVRRNAETLSGCEKILDMHRLS